jgi:hypothetical protein
MTADLQNVMARNVKTPPTRLDTLPTELLEAIIAHLIKTESDKRWTHNDQSRRDGDHLKPRTPTSAHTASQSRRRKWTINALTLLPKSNHISIVRRWIYPTPIYSPQYADLLNTRLTNRRLAAAAFHSFMKHIQTHPWDFKAWSLDRLANLLLNEQVAKRITHLRFQSFRISHHDQGNDFSPAASAKNREERIAYITSHLKHQLLVICQRVASLHTLILISELIWMPENDSLLCEEASRVPVPSPEMSFRIFYDGPNPLPCLQAALEESNLGNKLQEMTMYTHHDWDFFNEKLEGPLPKSLVCGNVRKLTIDPIQMMNQEFRMDCPGLKVLEMLNLERAKRWRISILHHRLSTLPDLERHQLDAMFNSITHIVFNGSSIPNAISPGRISTSTIYSLISYIARCTTGVERLTIKHAILHDDRDGPGWRRSVAPKDKDGRLLDDIENVRDLEIVVLELDGVEWVEYVYKGGGMVEKNKHSLNEEKEVWEKLGGMERLVGRVEFTSPRTRSINTY